MRRNFHAGLVVIAGILVPLVNAGTAVANPVVAVGDSIKFSDRPGSPGGEFLATVNNAWSFVTFCLQKTEYIDFTNTFVVDAVTDYATSDPTNVGGNAQGHDPIDQRTAWLYTQFTRGSLAGYQYVGTGAQRTASANLLQNAIWMIENEIAMDSNQYYVKKANEAVAAGWSGIHDVRALNLRRLVNGQWVESQDQLTRVPEPSSVLLFGFGLAAFGARRFRRDTRS
jgi:hypothetical protein